MAPFAFFKFTLGDGVEGKAQHQPVNISNADTTSALERPCYDHVQIFLSCLLML